MKTDLKDKNKIEIEVGDILKVHWKELSGNEYDDIEVVILSNGGLYMQRVDDKWKRCLDLINSCQIEGNVEILGNIKGDSPESFVKNLEAKKLINK